MLYKELWALIAAIDSRGYDETSDEISWKNSA